METGKNLIEPVHTLCQEEKIARCNDGLFSIMVMCKIFKTSPAFETQ